MTLGRNKIWVSGMALALAAAGSQASAQSSQPSTQQQQSVPDAPVPQTLPTLNTITPVSPAVPDAPAPKPDADTTDNGGVVPGSTLPSSAAQTAQSQQDEGPPPELPTAGQGPSAANRLSVNVQFVQIPFTVKDSKGHLVSGLTWRDVRVYENGLRQQMRYFTTDPFPLSVALVIDQSVTYDTMEKINDSLGALQNSFSPYDEVAVFTYNNGVTKQTDFTAAQSARLGAILERSKGTGREPVMGLTGPLTQTTMINNQQVDPNTTPVRGQQGITLTPPKEYHTLNDAILAAAQETTTAQRGRRRIVYVISDGKEYGSKASQKEVIKYMQRNNVALWGTLVGDSGLPGTGFIDRIHLPLTMRDDVLPKYAAATGGQLDPEFRPKGIEASFERISNEVRSQYTVGYYTHESPLNESYRRVEIRVLRPGLTIISKDGYYPSAADNRPSQPVATKTSATP